MFKQKRRRCDNKTSLSTFSPGACNYRQYEPSGRKHCACLIILEEDGEGVAGGPRRAPVAVVAAQRRLRAVLAADRVFSLSKTLSFANLTLGMTAEFVQFQFSRELVEKLKCLPPRCLCSLLFTDLVLLYLFTY